MYLISDNIDTLTGMRLAGVDGVVVHERSELKNAIEACPIKAIQLGAKGYILKQAFETIAPALTAVYNGQTVFGNEIMDKIPSLLQKQMMPSYEDFLLTEKEFELICLVADGLNNKEIASKLFLSEGTVRNYISTILEKLNLRDRTQLACFYYKHF